MSKLVSVYKKVKGLVVRQEEGASMVEYALLVALIALVAIAGVTVVGTKLSGNFNNIANKL